LIALGVIIYLIRARNLGRGVLPEGFYPVPSNALADDLVRNDQEEIELKDDEENL